MSKLQMLIGRKFAFIHVPKTGGVSIRYALASHGQPNDHYPHISARCLRDRIGRRQFGRRLTFAFVRHPLSWLVSCFHHVRRQQSEGFVIRWRLLNWHYVLGHSVLGDEAESQPIDAYLERVANTLRVMRDGSFGDFVEEGAAGRLDVIPQSEWIVDERGSVMVAYLGRFEELATHLQDVCARIGINGVNLPHENKGAYSNDWRDYYDDRLERLAIDWMRPEFDKLGYPARR